MKALNKCVVKECIWNYFLVSNMGDSLAGDIHQDEENDGGGGSPSLVLGRLNLTASGQLKSQVRRSRPRLRLEVKI